MDPTTIGLIGGIAAAWVVAGVATWKRPLLGTAVAGGLGSLVSLYLARQHANPGGSICNINDTFNCDLVNTSSYSELAGVPIAVVGAAFYLAITLVAGMALKDKEKYPNASVLITLFSIPAVVYAAFLAWASTQIGAWCLFCISTYGLSAILLASGVLGAQKGGALGARIGSTLAGSGDRSMSTFVLGGLACFALLMVTCGGPDATEQVADADITDLYAQPHGEVKLNGDEPVYGKIDAPITVLEWADYECPHCGRVAPQLKELAQLYPDHVRLIFRNYPLDQACNANVGPMHPNSCHAARASICAQEQGKFWELNAKMFANQSYLAIADILFMSQEIGIDPDQLASCIDSELAYSRVARDVADGQAAGIHGTPSIFLLGVHESGWIFNEMGVEGAKLLIDAKLAGEVLPPPPPPRD